MAGFDWLSFANSIGDINQKGVDQDWNTSFSAVSDPAGFLYNQGYLGMTPRDKQRKALLDREFALKDLASKRADKALSEQIRQNGVDNEMQKRELGLSTLNMLANQRQQAGVAARSRNFQNALYQAAIGTGGSAR